MHADQRDRIAERFGGPADLDAARSPGRHNVIDDDRCLASALHVAKLLGAVKLESADVYRPELGVE
jgi:hypothetical protein